MRIRAAFLVAFALALAVGTSPIQALPISVTYQDPEGDTIGDYPAQDVVASTKKVRQSEDGRIWIAFTIRAAASPGSGLLYGFIYLDTDGDGSSDANIRYVHWDNGDRPDYCTLRLSQSQAIERWARQVDQRFTCVFLKKDLQATARVGWYVSSYSYTPMTEVDRAPDYGWYR